MEIIIKKKNKEQFTMNGKDYDVVEATCTYSHLEEVMSDVAKEILPENLWLLYKQMFMEIRLMKNIMGKRW